MHALGPPAVPRAVAEFERDLIAERTRAGLAAARVDQDMRIPDTFDIPIGVIGRMRIAHCLDHPMSQVAL